jgi:hypothetical protein
MKHAYRWIAPLALSLLTACGGSHHNNPTGPSSVTLGGSVAGLTAAGLVLANGSDTVTVAANATSYQFPTAIAAGAAYSVSVQTQPTGETCTVANPSGTASANVTDANVSCTANAPVTYTLGGSVSGLTAAGLVLANGSDTVTVAANATSYQFPTAVAQGSSYTVSVHTQPAGETCTVANATGTMGSADVANANVSCSPIPNYTIGGSASGLTAQGLVLADNGGDPLTVPAYATSFQFATALPSGTAYAVTVKTQPAGETCTITGDSGSATGDVTNVAVTCATNFSGGAGNNVATIVVAPGPAAAGSQTFNMPYVSVKVCDTGTPQKCAVIDNVQVDTGSAGLRLLSSALTSAGLSLTPMKDGSNNPIEECHPFGGGYVSWGAVAAATITVGGETTGGATNPAPIAVQVIDGSTPPTDCTNSGAIQQSSVDDFDANGVLGVGLFPQDCGTVCATTMANSWYYSCPTPTTCTRTTVALAAQVVNPVTTFTTDNNGVAVQLQTLPAGGALTATGYLVFGIGTETNNGLSSGASANILTPNASGYISTQITGPTAQSAVNGFFDSGSNTLLFDTTDLAQCTGATAGFYCPDPPPAPQSITVTNGGGAAISIDIANLADLLSNPATENNFAFDDIGAYTTGEFDWGLPFFYGRTVYTAIQDATVDGTPYTNGFYAY